MATKRSEVLREVLPKDRDTWQVRAPKAVRASAIARTKGEAVERAREIVANLGGGEVRVHSPRGGTTVEIVDAAPGSSADDRIKTEASRLRGVTSLLRLTSRLEKLRSHLQQAPVGAAEHDLASDAASRFDLWSSLFGDELGRLRDIRNVAAHPSPDLDQATVDEGISIAARLLDLLVSAETSRTYPGQWVAIRDARIVDADPKLSALVERVGDSPQTRVIFQEPVAG